MQKLGEYLREMGAYTQKSIDRRASQGATGYEIIEMAVNLGNTAILGAGAWIGVNDGQGIRVSGKYLEIDHENPLTQIALHAAQSMKALNDITTAMDGGNSHFSPKKASHLKLGKEGLAYRAGQRILATLYRESHARI